MSEDPKSVDKLLDQIQGESEAVQAAATAGDAAEIAGVADAVNQIAGEMAAPSASGNVLEQPPAGGVEAALQDDFAPPPVVEESSDVKRLLAIEVPVIVRLGSRKMSVGEVMRFAVGAIIEFGKSAEEELDLLANNKNIGKGHAVKVGENFGIKISSIGSVKETIRKLGAI